VATAAVGPDPRIATTVDDSALPVAEDSQIAFDERGLVPCVVQDWRTGEVLTVAYMNAESLRRTRETGEMHFFSRSRQELWHKGAASGNTQTVKAIRYDCDADTLLALVEPAGPACHTGERSCFYRGELEPVAPFQAVAILERTIAERARARPDGSYTARLLNDPELARAKVSEEAGEVARASLEESDERVAEEAADVIYHLAVLLRERGLSLADAERVLDARRKP
jgi:phosphoribosyl-ATP pyrophosphohydrolase/phosphoribosyl-AMP cyclohydrolase